MRGDDVTSGVKPYNMSKVAEGWGGIFIMDFWGWPDPSLTHEAKEAAMKDVVSGFADLALNYGEFTHPVNLFHDIEDDLRALAEQGRRRLERSRAERARLAGLLALRDELVPLNRKYPIAELMDACRRFIDKQDSRSRITFEYVMLRGVNDSLTHADELCDLLRNKPAKVNLIPFNPFPGTHYRTSPAERVEAFRQRLKRAGIIATTRKTRGDDIDAACGQLVGKVRDRSRRQFKRIPVVMEGRQ